MSTPPVGSTDPTAGAGGLAATSAQDLSNQFLTMLTAQMNNQDPLNPLDNSELTSQLAQISTVSGISQLNTTMQWLGYSVSSLQSTQSASLIGHKVLVAGDSLTLADGTVTGGYNLPLAVDSAQVVISDADGNQVATIKLPDVDVGTHTFTWDGKTSKGGTAPDGKYTFEVDVSQGDQVGTATALNTAQVASVQPFSGGTAVIDGDGNTVNLTDVYQVW